MQHAVGTRPDPAHGYCTDDVARALRVDLLHQRELGWAALPAAPVATSRSLATRSSRRDGPVPQLPRRRRLMARRRWLGGLPGPGAPRPRRDDPPGPGPVARRVGQRPAGTVPARRARADGPARPRVGAPRPAWPPSAAGMDGEAASTLRLLAVAPGGRVRDVHRAGLALAGTDPHLRERAPGPGAASPPALTSATRRWSPPASASWTGSSPSRRRQPATCRRSATAGGRVTASARSSTSSRSRRPPSCSPRTPPSSDGTSSRHRRAVEQAYGWFLGANDVGIAVAGPGRGACHDGLDARRRERQPGRGVDARAWLLALEHVRRCARPGLSSEPALRPPAATRACRLPSDDPARRRPRCSGGRTANPILTRGGRALPGQLRLQPRRRSRRRRDDPPSARRGPAGHLPAPRGAEQDGVTDWRFDPEPLLRADVDHYPEEIWGCEDPRLTLLSEREEWAIAYTAYSRRGPLVSLAMTRDFRSVRRLGPVMPPEDKDAALFPRRFDGRWAMIHRPSPLRGGAHMWISFSPDLRHWGDHRSSSRRVTAPGGMPARSASGRRPSRRPEGWLVMYHGVHATAPARSTGPGLALLDLENPRLVIRPHRRVGLRAVGALRGCRRRRPRRLPLRLGPRILRRGRQRLLRRRPTRWSALATVRLEDLLACVRNAPGPRPRGTSALRGYPLTDPGDGRAVKEWQRGNEMASLPASVGTGAGR